MKIYTLSYYLTKGITLVILVFMKTAISIPDPIFESAEKMAKELGVSRSELYTKALANFLETHQGTSVTETLNKVHTQVDSRLEPEISQIQFASIEKDPY